MKITIKIDERCTKLYLQAETFSDAAEIMQAVRMIKSPVRAYGHLDRAGAWAWIIIPNQKKVSEYNSTSFDNGVDG